MARGVATPTRLKRKPPKTQARLKGCRLCHRRLRGPCDACLNEELIVCGYTKEGFFRLIGPCHPEWKRRWLFEREWPEVKKINWWQVRWEKAERLAQLRARRSGRAV